jgi:hypothetical protein
MSRPKRSRKQTPTERWAHAVTWIKENTGKSGGTLERALALEFAKIRKDEHYVSCTWCRTCRGICDRSRLLEEEITRLKKGPR